MPAEKDQQAIVGRIEQLLAAAAGRNVHLRLDGSRFDDDWLYVVVSPTRKGERASSHARTMTEIERTLQAEGYDQVLIVPTRAGTRRPARRADQSRRADLTPPPAGLPHSRTLPEPQRPDELPAMAKQGSPPSRPPPPSPPHPRPASRRPLLDTCWRSA